MIHAYFNYLHYQIIIHYDPNCAQLSHSRAPHQRLQRVDTATIGPVLAGLARDAYPFSPQLGEQALWLQIDFDGDHDFERAVQRYALRLISQNYPRFRHVTATNHC